MESRKITIISNRDQKTYVIMSAATTLEELKADLDKENIYYSGMSFFEGLTQTELKSDGSILPTDVPYRGTTTNELLFCLTQSNKKIASGMERSECYETIKNNNWNEEVKKLFGKNFTQCSTVDLVTFINSKALKKAIVEDKEYSNLYEGTLESNIHLLAEAIIAIIDRKPTNEVRKELVKTFNIKSTTTKQLESSYSEEEIENILGFIH